jgi:hypothetical protein
MWCAQMKWIFKSHRVGGYANSTIKQPDPRYNCESAKNWETNDTHTCTMIISNINALQIPNIKQCCTSHQM